MNNYVLLYRFDEEEKVKQFEKGIQKEFPRHKFESDGDYYYFGFADRAEPGVVDTVDGILNSMGFGVTGYFGKRDYVALYFSREADPDNIKRQLLIGTEEMVEAGAETMSADAHRSAIQNLLAFDYVKAFPEA
ncbi:hypothetical protein [Pontibacter harenae]|uniref:hypothetical protein n=1 Tax=Pontibacter harenae TaxID=2894083 RepID=UPI001E35E596|nr:hypothetical protein [Pontibacter harenae]MCC9165604.1 hypothetical protein [Pontibacter harenae]